MSGSGGLYAVVPAGGSGTRLWPLSRSAAPKFLHPLGGGSLSMLQETVDRIAPLAAADRTLVVSGVAHAAAVARQLPAVPGENLLVEPAPRDSGPAIGLAAAVIHHRDPTAVMASFASDHEVTDRASFLRAVRLAAALAEAGSLVTIGMTPTRPETGYGYLRTGAALPVEGGFAVEEFTEKPPYEVAKSYVDSGRYLWNASMFVWRTEVFLAELARQLPDLHENLTRIAADWDTDRRDATLGELWPSCTKISVDHGVMEGAAARGLVACVPADFGWNDVGDFDAVGTIAGPGDSGAAIVGDGTGDNVVAIDSPGAVIVPSSGRMVATLGMPDTIVVDTADAVLVCPRSRAQDIKSVVDALREAGRTDLL